MLEKKQKEDIINQFKISESDTGSSDIQVALLTARITQLTEHLRLNRHDHHSRHQLLKVIGKRRRFLTYLAKTEPERYYSLITRLGLRK